MLLPDESFWDMAEKLEETQRTAVRMISTCLGVLEYKTSMGELEE